MPAKVPVTKTTTRMDVMHEIQRIERICSQCSRPRNEGGFTKGSAAAQAWCIANCVHGSDLLKAGKQLGKIAKREKVERKKLKRIIGAHQPTKGGEKRGKAVLQQ